MQNLDGKPPPSDSTCIDCGRLITATVGGVAICENCLAVRGSCCAEFGGNDLTAEAEEEKLSEVRERASPVCYATLFEDTEARMRPCQAKSSVFKSSVGVQYLQ